MIAEATFFVFSRYSFVFSRFKTIKENVHAKFVYAFWWDTTRWFNLSFGVSQCTALPVKPEEWRTGVFVLDEVSLAISMASFGQPWFLSWPVGFPVQLYKLFLHKF